MIFPVKLCHLFFFQMLQGGLLPPRPFCPKKEMQHCCKATSSLGCEHSALLRDARSSQSNSFTGTGRDTAAAQDSHSASSSPVIQSAWYHFCGGSAPTCRWAMVWSPCTAGVHRWHKPTVLAQSARCVQCWASYGGCFPPGFEMVPPEMVSPRLRGC